MKKFLTVLLALSVVFTYTVGTAFAAPATPSGSNELTEAQVQAKIEAAYNQALTDAKAEKDAALNSIFKSGAKEVTVSDSSKSIVVTKTALEKVYNTLYDEVVKDINKAKTAALGEFTTAIKNATKYNGTFIILDSAKSETAPEGYATYNATWAEVGTYFTKSNKVNDTEAYTALFDVEANGNVVAASTKIVDVAKAVYEEVKDSTLKAVTAIDISLYSKAYNGTGSSDYDKANADKTNAISLINTYAVPKTGAGTTSTWEDYVTAIGVMTGAKGLYNAPVNNGSPTGVIYTGGSLEGKTFVGLDTLLKNADLPTEAAKLEWAQNLVLNKMIGAINTYAGQIQTTLNNTIVDETLKGDKGNATTIADAKEKLAALADIKAGAIETVTYLVKNADSYKDLVTGSGAFSTKTWDIDITKWAVNVAIPGIADASNGFLAAGKGYSFHQPLNDKNEAAKATAINHMMANIANLKAQAELAKASINIDGTTLVEIENALADALDSVYRGTPVTSLNISTDVKSVYNRQQVLLGNTTANTVKISDRTYDVLTKWVADLDRDYDKAYKDAVRKVLTDTETNIKAATTKDAADNAFLEGYKAFDAVLTKADKTTTQSSKEFVDLLAQYNTEIAQYIQYKSGVITGSDYDWTPGSASIGMTKNLQDTFKDAYSVDELKAAYTAARAEVDALKTKAQIKSDYDSLTAKINALAKSPTLADKATVMAVAKEAKAYTDYCTLVGSTLYPLTSTTVDRCIEIIQGLERKDLQDKYNTIMKDGKVTTDEAQAVAELRKAYDEVIASYTTANMDAADLANLKAKFPVDVDKVEGLLDTAQANAVKEMIAKLPADGSDVAGIKAARKAYNELSREAKYGVSGVYQSAYYDKLVDLEKLLVKGVEALKITASSKAYKGKIVVKWTVKGNATDVKYQVYKSNKKFSGYKKAFTTSKKVYNNTKNVKKGVRYYYKVRAYKVVDGKTYYSDWSSKAQRQAK